jgi:hypothetical protein
MRWLFPSINPQHRFAADTSVPWVDDDVRYPVQPWTPASTNPTWDGISRSDRCQSAQATHRSHRPLQVSSSGVTWGSG